MKEIPSNHPRSIKPSRTKRPLVLWIMLLVFTWWVALGWFRFFNAILNRELYLELVATWRFWFIVFAGLAWGLLAIPALVGILWRLPWAKRVSKIAGILYPLSYWVERLFIWAPDEPQVNWPFMLCLTLIWISILVWMQLSQKVRRYFNL